MEKVEATHQVIFNATPPPTKKSRDWPLITLLGSLSMACGFVYALQAPFYPIEAQSKGVSVTEIGIVFGIYELVSVFVSPVAGAALTRIGPLVGLYWGILLTGLGTVGLGVLSFLADKNAFFLLSLLFRIVQSIGASFRAIAVLSMATFAFPKTVATVLASIEGIISIGSCLGGFLGGAMMQITSYMTTFTLSGAVVVLAIFPSMVVFRRIIPPTEEHTHSTNGEETTISKTAKASTSSTLGLWTLLCSPSISLCVFSLVSASLSYGAATVVMEPNLQQFDPTPMQVGLIFVCPMVAYLVTAQIIGIICDRLKSKPAALRAMQYIGPSLLLLGFVIIGPVPFLPFGPSMPLIAVALTLLGVGGASTSVSSFLIAVQEGKQIATEFAEAAGGVEDELKVHELISGLWRASVSLGFFAGPTLSGFLYDRIGFRNECTLIVGLQLFHLALICGCGCVGRRRELKN